MPALSATLACAKKRGVVDFEGELLMQGADDNVLIALMSEEVDRSDDFKSISVAAPNQQDASIYAPGKCCLCAKTVYPAERLAANGKVFHKMCFRCLVCNKVLLLSAYAHLDGKFYCEPHFKALVNQNPGYGFTTPLSTSEAST